MAADTYATILEPGRAQLRVLGSNFFGVALPVSSPDEVTFHLEEEKQRHHAATHWCWAARWGGSGEVVKRSADGGEPRGTAGASILREIQRRGLLDCLVIVTRYFGGTKLGLANLARAYAECAAQALDTAVVVRHAVLSTLRVRCPFDDIGVVYGVTNRFHAEVEAESHAETAVFLVKIARDQRDRLRDALVDEGRGRIIVEDAA
jgi:putative IMPACT (imprinted ancient) family translation regulator